jgi:putative transposase
MKKNRTKTRVGKDRSGPRRLAPTRGFTPPWGPLDPRARLLEVVLAQGFEGVIEMLEADREALCGPKGLWQPERTAYRYGHDQGRLVLGGRTVKVPRPRVRGVNSGEIELPTWRRFAEEDPLHERALEQILLGVSTRKYANSLETIPEELGAGSTSSSSVSRRFVAATQRRVEEFLSRPLDALDLPVILLDGTGFDGDHVLVTAVGIDTVGVKHVLGVVEGTTEGEEVCLSLLRNLIDRGLKVERARLFVIDGGKGLRKAIRTVFAGWALVHRCHVHKLRNVAEHLPKHRRAWVRAAMRKAWGLKTVKEARQKLTQLAAQLEDEHPGAAGSIREGLEETLTLIQLGVTSTSALHRTLCSTNPIENLMGSLKRVTRNVKRWRGGKMAVRWAVAGMVEAEKRFRKIRGHRDIPQLVAALDAVCTANKVDTQERVA